MSGPTVASRAWILRLLALSAVACTSTTTQVAKRFSLEHSCQLDQVLVRENGGNEYIAEGCSQRAKYVCSSIASMGAVKSTAGNCAEEGVRPPGPVGLPERRSLQPGAEDPPR
jgi:hypothetical protein